MNIELPVAPPSATTIHARLLRQIRRDLSKTLEPELHSAYAKFTATTVGQMLDRMILWLETGGDHAANRERAELLADLGVKKTTDNATQLVPDFDDLAALGIPLEAALTDASDGTLAKLGAIEAHMFDREGAAIQRAAEIDESTLAAIETEVTPELLDHYFENSDQFRGCQTAAIVRIPGGYSKDTFLVTTTGGSGPAELVIRRDFPFGPTDSSAADEFAIFDRLSKVGFPLPRALDAVRDRSVLGQPFLVMEKKSGINALTLFRDNPALARSVCLELATILGRLHALDPVQTGFLEKGDFDAPGVVRQYLARWRAHWLRHRIHAAPLAEAAFIWLERNVPRDIPQLVLVHGDARPDNMLIENERVTALLDWEFTHVGDPAEDLEYTRLFAEPYVAWQEFIAAYREAGGPAVGDSASRFYEVWRSLRNFVCCDVSWGGFVAGHYPVLKLSAQGVIWRRYFLKTIATALERLT